MPLSEASAGSFAFLDVRYEKFEDGLPWVFCEKEIELLIRKLELDKEILAGPDEVDWNKAPGDEAAN